MTSEPGAGQGQGKVLPQTRMNSGSERSPMDTQSTAPRLLTLPQERTALLSQTELDGVAVLAFTPELARLEPEAFVRDVLRERYGMRELVLGYDHGFGRGRAGDVETVRRIGAQDGFDVDVVPPVRDGDGAPISSSLIRAAVAHGDLDRAAAGLGRRYTITGEVVAGAGRGRTIGIPTANVEPDPRKLLPPDGVYAVRLHWRGATHYFGCSFGGA